MSFVHRKLYKQKPQAFGPVSAVQASIFKNAERIGIDPASISLAIPTWERAGKVRDFISNTDITLPTGVSWRPGYVYNNYAKIDTGIASKVFTEFTLCMSCFSDSTQLTQGLFDTKNGTADYATTTGWSAWTRKESGLYKLGFRVGSTETLVNDTHFNQLTPQNLAFVWKASAQQHIFVDGIGYYDYTTAASYVGTNNYIIGSFYDFSAGRNLRGGIDHVFLFNKALTTSQILYQADNPYYLLHRVAPVFYSVPGGAITIKTITDTVSCLDEIAQISNIFALSDTGTCLDGFSGLIAGLSVVDAGAGVDTVKPIASLTVQDTGSAIDMIQQISAACSVADTGAGADSIGQLLASLVISDAGAGADVITVLKELLKTVTDSGTGTDSISLILASLSVADTGSSTDTISQILAGVSVSDTGTCVDFIALLKDILKTISDTGSGSDSVSIQPVSVSVQDAGTALDIIGHIAVALSVSDAGTISEIISTIKTKMVTVTDTWTGSDSAPNISVSLTVSDTAAALDLVGQVINSLTVSDTGYGLERITKTDFNILPSGKVTVTFTIKTPGASLAMRTPKANFNIE